MSAPTTHRPPAKRPNVVAVGLMAKLMPPGEWITSSEALDLLAGRGLPVDHDTGVITTRAGKTHIVPVMRGLRRRGQVITRNGATEFLLIPPR